MATIRTAIQLSDGITSTLMNITNALNLTVGAFQDVQSTANHDIDVSAFGAIRDEINAATIAIQNMESQLDNVHPDPVRVPVQPVWNTQSNIDIFDGAGLDRLNNEMNSLNTLTDDVLKGQQRIGEQALKMDLLPPNASWDINFTNQRIEELGQKLANLQGQDISLMDDASVSKLNSEYEGMRSSMNSIINLQEQMNQAVEKGDISGLNAGYNQLNGIAEQVERKIRDNLAAIQQLNSVQWNSPQTIEMFDGSGVARYRQEIQSANDMMNRLSASQQQIQNQAANTALFPANMVSDITSMNSRISRLREQLEKMTSQRIDDIGADKANNDIEALRNQLNQALQAQEDLNSAMTRMDVSSANVAYNKLNGIVDSTERNIRDNINAQNQFNNSLKSGGDMAGSLKQQIAGMVATYLGIQGVSKVLDISDQMTNTTARLNMMNDGLQTTQDLQNMIFLAAERSRGAYQGTADAVSKIGIMAKDAFGSNTELIAFAEQLNKQFVIAGTSTQGIDAAMLQLTQAMGSGVLRGEELNSVFEQAPTIIQTISDYLDVPIGSIRAMAQEGQITADIVKAALLTAADETDARFNAMPKTFGQIATSMKNNALMAFQPILNRISEIANSPAFQVLAQNVINAFVIIAGIVTEIFNLVAMVGQFISDNWSLIAPIVYGVAAALGVYYGWMLLCKIATWAQAAAQGALTLAKMLAVPIYAAMTGATMAETAAQWGLNAALYACPIVWIIIIIIALIALVYLVVAAVNKFAGTSVSATGIIFGAFAVLGAFLWNLFLGLLDLVFGVINAMVNPFIRIANFIGNVFTNPISSIIYLFQSMADGVLAILQKIASALDFVFGSSMADAVAGWRSGLKDMADSAVAKYAPNENYQNVMDELDLSVESVGLKRWEYGDAWNTGYSAGESVDNAVANFDPASLFNSNIPGANDYANTFDPSSLQNGVGNIDNNTGAMKDSMAASEEDLKYLRDIAERETINRFTTAELTVHFDSKNEIKSDLDLDGVVSYLEEKVTETLEAVAEGVHE